MTMPANPLAPMARRVVAMNLGLVRTARGAGAPESLCPHAGGYDPPRGLHAHGYLRCAWLPTSGSPRVKESARRLRIPRGLCLEALVSRGALSCPSGAGLERSGTSPRPPPPSPSALALAQAWKHPQMVPPDGALVSELLPPKDEELLFIFLVKNREGRGEEKPFRSKYGDFCPRRSASRPWSGGIARAVGRATGRPPVSEGEGGFGFSSLVHLPLNSSQMPH